MGFLVRASNNRRRLIDRGIQVRYYLDETSVGSSDSFIRDHGPNRKMHLRLINDSDNLLYNGPDGNRGIECSATTGVQKCDHALTNGDKVLGNLVGTKTITVEMRARVTDGAAGEGRVFAIQQDGSANTSLGFNSNSTTTLTFWWDGVKQRTWDPGNDVNTWTAVVDTNLTGDDKVKIYKNGVFFTTTVDANPADNDLFSDPVAGYLVKMFNRGTGQRSIIGKIQYAAMYSAALDLSEVLRNHEVLLFNDDAPRLQHRTYVPITAAAPPPSGTDLIRWAGFAAPTVAGEQDYTIPGIGTPTGVLIFMSDVDSVDTDGGQGRYTVGLSDMTDARTVCITDWNTQPTTVSQRGTAGERVGGDWLIIDFNNNDTGILSSAFLVGTITDGIRVDWTDPAPKAQRIMVCFFLDGVTCKVIDFANSGSGDPHTFALTGIGFKPDTMFLTSIRTNATTFPDPGTAVVEQALTLGIAHDDGGAAPFPNFSVNIFNKDNAAITRTGGDFDSLHCLSNITGQVASDRKFEVTSFDSDGVTIEVSGTANATVSRHMALFIKWPAGAKTDLRSIDTRTTVGNLDINVGFAAQSGILIGSDHTAVNTHEIDGKAFGISLGGFADDGASIENFCLTLAVRDGVTTSSNRTRATETDALENYVHTGALSYEADVSLLTSPNVRLNFTIVNSPARKVIMLSVAPAAVGIEIFRRRIEGYK